MTDTTQPLGIFDSGIGGLTVARAISSKLPRESFVYFGDTAHLPYGDKSPRAIRKYVRGIADFLIQKQCKLIVVACNSASATAYHELCQYVGRHVPVVNVIDPVIAAVSHIPGLRKAGVIGTQRTIRSGIYARRLHEKQPEVEVVSMATPLLAPMIEAGFFDHTISQTVIDQYLRNKRLKGIDALILACTHYPLIRAQIANYYGSKVAVPDTTAVIAGEVEHLLKQHGLQHDGAQPSQQNHFFVSDYTDAFVATTRYFYGQRVSLTHYPLWER